ncbi:MAG: hypothetical protein V4760_12635 [Bdellovibrionota bacterium]
MRHPWLNRIAVLVGVSTLLLVALGYIVYKERPSLRKIAASLSTVQKPRYSPASQAGRGFDFRSMVNALIGPEPVYPPHLSEDATEALIGRFIESGDTDVRVCEMLGELRDAPPRGAADVHAWASDRIANRMENPYLEAMLIPIGAVLSRSGFAPVATRVRDAAFGGDVMPDFDVLQAQARSDLYSAAPQLEDVSLRAYHLYALFRSVNWHPELAQDFATIELCEQIEERLETAIAGEYSGISLRSETAELLSWMAANRVTAQESGFEPALAGTMSVLVTPTSVAFESPWMKNAFGTGLVLGLPPAIETSVQAGR